MLPHGRSQRRGCVTCTEVVWRRSASHQRVVCTTLLPAGSDATFSSWAISAALLVALPSPILFPNVLPLNCCVHVTLVSFWTKPSACNTNRHANKKK